MLYRKIETSYEVYKAILDAHYKKGLRVFESFSDPEGFAPYGYGYPRMDTAWGIEGAPCPIIYATTRWERKPITEPVFPDEQTHEYFLCIPIEDKDN